MISEMNPKVDFFFNKAKQWKAEYERLREIALSTEMTEELKWGCPCYQVNEKNVVLIHGFKEYCALLFMKGALLDDPEGILVIQTENVQASRQIRFSSLEEIEQMEDLIRQRILQAIQVEKAGLKVEMKSTREFEVVEELQAIFDADPDFKAAFERLTPGRQRAYLLHFSAAKQSKTRLARIEKYAEKILEGKGLDD
jgi:uncharacterized protein YdeI (YjbR/CyaY-like superfamily)